MISAPGNCGGGNAVRQDEAPEYRQDWEDEMLEDLRDALRSE
jgi:hypothetical protein